MEYLINCWRVLSALRDYYSHSETDAELIPICDASARELSARVKPNADCSDIRLINAAAAMVNYRLCVRRMHSDEGITSFKAGDVTISISPEALREQAEKDKTEAIIAAAPLLKDYDFLFRQVSI